MGKRNKTNKGKAKLEVKKETLRKLEISPADLQNVNGGAGTGGGGAGGGGTYPSGGNIC